MRALVLLTALCLSGLNASPGLHAQDQSVPPRTEAQLDEEARQAEGLHDKSQMLTALPLYEDLLAHRPQNSMYMERLAMCYVAKAATLASPTDARTVNQHAYDLLLQAQKAGDRSGLLQVMLEKLGDALASPVAAPISDPKDPRAPGSPFERAELLFNKGDLAGASKLYQQSLAEHPNFYPAPLYAGDSEYKLGHFDEAGIWFAKAIAIAPDAETAHRYWADCLMKAGKPKEARAQFIEAFIADPYTKAPRLSLRGYAQQQNIRYVPPPITLPDLPTTGKDGKTNITMTVDPKKKDDPMGALSLGYSMNSTLWQWKKFKEQFPNEKVYRHSLAEEVDSIHTMLVTARELKIPPAKYDATIRTLMELEKDNMIECWILLDAPDQGTAQDYLAYRATHKDLLRAYIEKYDLHPA